MVGSIPCGGLTGDRQSAAVFVFTLRCLAMNMVRPIFLLMLLIVLAVAPAIAQDDLTTKDTISAIDGRTIEGVIAAIDQQGQIHLVDGSSIGLAQVLDIARNVTVEEKRQLPIEVHLAHGGTLLSKSAQLNNERVALATSFGSIELPIESVRAIVFRPASLTDAVSASIASPSNQFDSVWAESSEGLHSASGLVRSIADGKVMGEFSGQDRSISLAKVVAYVAADLGLKPPTGLAQIHLSDGSQVLASIDGLVDQRLTVQIPGGVRAEIPWGSVARIAIESDRLVWISDLQPIESIQEPLVTNSRATQNDRSIDGNPLTLRTSQQRELLKFDKGLGVHAYARLVYRNDAGYDRLNAIAGIDSETQGYGDCVFSVRGDGIELWSQRIRGTDDPVIVEVDVSNVQEISLIVEPGAQLDLADHANWCNARLLKTK